MNKIKYLFGYLWFNKYLLVALALSLYGNYHLIKAQYNLRCNVNGQSVGWIVSKNDCQALVDARFDSQELARLTFLKENNDIR